MEFTFDFNLSLRAGLKIEASSEEEAREILAKMNLDQIQNSDDFWCKDETITDIDVTRVDGMKVDVKLENLQYEPAWYEFDSEEEKQKLIDLIPTEVTLTVELSGDESLELKIDEELEMKYDASGKFTYSYEIIKKY